MQGTFWIMASLLASLVVVGCDDGDDGGGTSAGPSLDQLVGYWEQVACADDQGNEVPCLVEISYARRDLEFFDDGSVQHYFSMMGGPPEGGGVRAQYEAGELCNEIVGCFDIRLVDGSLLYCLTPSACEMFERG